MEKDNTPMDDGSAHTNQNLKISTGEKNGKGKLFASVLGVLALLILVASASYYFGTKTTGGSDSLASPAPEGNQLGLSAQSTPAQSSLQIPTTLASPSPAPLDISPTATPLAKTKTLAPISDLDGFRSSNGAGNQVLDIRSGKNANLVSRGFVTFDISDLPSDATLSEATLRLYQTKIVGNPYTDGGKLKIDHLTYGDSLDNADYAMAALTSSFATLSTNAKVEWKEADTTARLKDDIANARSMSQFRIHFETENTGGDATGDFAYFESADNSEETGNIPQLVVKYY